MRNPIKGSLKPMITIV